MSAATANNNDHPKVVYISTRYVETDPLSFKSVVQSLTGNTSSAAAAVDSLNRNSTHVVLEKRNKKSVIGTDGSNSDGGRAMLETPPADFSCGDFSRALLEIPNSDIELNSVYGDLLFNSPHQSWLTTNL